ncbi:5-formyltetrahydrofolate cyclo-ligase [Thalassotalea sp. G2M2-11]|uniref:5-formyltetrahydrofolate cyclo-ligase n=1 Tax=Thalassotalea sp. G2M2-11 TaxID=2787627 RepID=UPI0019D30E8D|nr:5-formyltetrahydrofolate cyclo-ligase [Thalassotalea sp. G2M2-11]
MHNHHNRQALRQQIRQARSALSPEFQQQASQLLVKQLQGINAIACAKKVAIYLANDGELNTAEFIQWCWSQDIATYIPVLHPFSKGHLLFLHYQASTEMVINKYGISEPKLDIRQVCPPTSFDIIFTPLVAFDRTGARLGMGGGYYDRTLAKLTAPEPKIIGLAHDCQELPAIPTENWDIPLKQIITPTTCYQFS